MTTNQLIEDLNELSYNNNINNNTNNLFNYKTLKLSGFLFLIYLLISSKSWSNYLIKKMKMTDGFDSIKPIGYIFNGAVLIIFYLILNALIANNII